jgi:hypothetical protein
MNHRCAVTYDLYLAAWSEITADQRRALVDRSLSDRIVFANPQQHRVGKAAVIEHLEGFQRRTPGGSFRMNNMVGWGEHALAEWQLVDAQGQPDFSGYDVVTFDQEGLISNILLFGNVEAQKLAWRRRNPVALELTD